MPEVTERNAMISDAFLGFEDHGYLTIVIHCTGEGWGQGFGCRAFGSEEFSSFEQAAAFTNYVRDLLNTFEVSEWNSLKGKLCRVRGTNSKIEEIGHIIKDKWMKS